MDLLFTASSIKRLLFLILSTVAAFLVYFSSTDSQANWCVWVTLLFGIVSGDDGWKGIVITIITGVLCALLVFAVNLVAPFVLWLSLFLFLATMGLSLVVILSSESCEESPHSAVTKRFFIPPTALFRMTKGAMIINLLIILASTQPISLSESISRELYIFVGLAIVGFSQLIFIPHSRRDELKAWLTISIDNLSRLTDKIFSCLTHLNYIDNKYLFEKRLHSQKNKCIQSILHLKNERLLNQCNKLYNLLLGCAQLRHRVTDFTIFGLCAEEMQSLLEALNICFSDLIKLIFKPDQTFDPSQLENSIARFEQIYQKVLQVTAKEPVVFLLFISDLQLLPKELIALANLMHKNNAEQHS